MNPQIRRACSVMFIAVFIAFVAGCDGSSSKMTESKDNSPSDPLAWFDELSRHATQRDTAYIRAHARTHVLAARPAAKANATASDPAVALCDALMFSQPLETAATNDGNRIMLSVAQYSAGVLGGSAWEYSIDLYRDGDGWKIDSWPYGHRSMSTAGKSSATFEK